VAGAAGMSAFTPAQAREKIKEIQDNKHHPYWNANHENHVKAKKEMADLFTMAHPSKKSS
jgi:hypothetical protein